METRNVQKFDFKFTLSGSEETMKIILDTVTQLLKACGVVVHATELKKTVEPTWRGHEC